MSMLKKVAKLNVCDNGIEIMNIDNIV